MNNERCNICKTILKEVYDRNNCKPLDQLNKNIKICCSTCNTKYVIGARIYGINEIKSILPDYSKVKYGIK